MEAWEYARDKAFKALSERWESESERAAPRRYSLAFTSDEETAKSIARAARERASDVSLKRRAE